MTIPVELKPTITPELFSLLGEHSVGNVASLALAAVAGGVFALLVGIPLMRLSGLSAGIATFAVLGVTYSIFNNWTKIGPWTTDAHDCPGDDRLRPGDRGSCRGRHDRLSLPAQPSRGGSYAPPARIRLQRERQG